MVKNLRFPIIALGLLLATTASAVTVAVGADKASLGGALTKLSAGHYIVQTAHVDPDGNVSGVGFDSATGKVGVFTVDAKTQDIGFNSVTVTSGSQQTMAAETQKLENQGNDVRYAFVNPDGTMRIGYRDANNAKAWTEEMVGTDGTVVSAVSNPSSIPMGTAAAAPATAEGATADADLAVQ